MSRKSRVNFDLNKKSDIHGIVDETMSGKSGVNFDLKKKSDIHSIVDETMSGVRSGKKNFLNEEHSE
jgi:hypothetical protein